MAVSRRTLDLKGFLFFRKMGKNWFFRPLPIQTLVLALSLFSWVAAAESANYTFTRISNQKSITWDMTRLNNQGHVLWEESTGGQWKLWLYRGGANTLLGSSSIGSIYSTAALNDRDQAVWVQTDHDNIYLFSAGQTVRLTDSQTDGWNRAYPQINKFGHLTWMEWNQSDASNCRVALSTGGPPIHLGNGKYIPGPPRLNNQGQVVWLQDDGSNPDFPIYQVSFYDGVATTQLTSGTRQRYRARINDLGDVVWCQASADLSFIELILRRGGQTQPITQSMGNNYIYLLNNQGQVAWVSNTARLNLYSGGVNQEIDICDFTREPGFNDQGQIAYNSYYDELWFYNHSSGAKVQLDGNRRYRYDIQLNNHGQIVWWETFGSPASVYLATPQKIPASVNLLLLGN